MVIRRAISRLFEQQYKGYKEPKREDGRKYRVCRQFCKTVSVDQYWADEYYVSMCVHVTLDVGRLLTAAGCASTVYPEMKTVLRTYHSIPSMQLDDFTSRNLQDAPRMKAQLKGCCLPLEENNLPDSLEQVLQRRVRG